MNSTYANLATKRKKEELTFALTPLCLSINCERIGTHALTNTEIKREESAFQLCTIQFPRQWVSFALISAYSVQRAVLCVAHFSRDQ